MEQTITRIRTAGQQSGAERLGKRIVKILDSAVNLAVLTIFLLFMLYGFYALWDTNQIYRAADAQQYAMYKPAADGEESPSFAELQQMNADVFAWLTVYGTHIDYPVVQTSNNETYVNTSVMGGYSLSGSLFLDYGNQNDFSDFNSIIYGHHMEKNTMFGEIASFMDAAYFSERQYGNLYYKGKNYGLELFAFMEVDAYDYSVYKPGIQPGLERDYLNNLFDKALHSRDIGVTEQDRILLLSTCTATSTNGRHIVVARITDDIFVDAFPNGSENQGARIRRNIDSLSAFEILLGLPWWVWIFPLILLILIILLFVTGKKKRKQMHGEILYRKT